MIRPGLIYVLRRLNVGDLESGGVLEHKSGWF
jgi:hypothetical protein